MTKEILKNEILSDAQLDTVSGGNESELSAIADALKMTDGLSPMDWYGSFSNEHNIKKRLNTEFGIQITSKGDVPHTYLKDGKKLTHLEVMGIIRKKYPYKNIMDDILGTG